jgi:CRISPR-associated protein Cas5t
MRVLRVVAEGLTTSFRYPHFIQSIHPTYEMPPPATIYGHICSTLGRWFNPDGVQFAYHFTFSGQVTDLEHIIVLTKSTGKLPETDMPKVLEGWVNPFDRHILFHPKIVLYINRPEWESSFRSPRYAVGLGRSQDLFTYSRVDIVDLERAEQVYLEHTLLPYEMALQTTRGYTVLMPRFVDYKDNRRPTFARYVILRERIRSDQDLRLVGGQDSPSYWVDPDSPKVNGAQLGLVFHSFVGDSYESLRMA